MSERLHFFGSRFRLFNYMSSIFLLYFLRKKRVRNELTPPSHCAGGKNHGYLRLFGFKSRISTSGDYFFQVSKAGINSPIGRFKVLLPYF